jgi:uncharacterized protein (UPF0335 family)
MDTGGIAAERLYAFIQRIEKLQEELDALNDDKGEIFKEAKMTGFDTNAMKAVIKRRRNGKGATEEADAILSLYEQAVENEVAKNPAAWPSRTRTRDDTAGDATSH